MKYLSLILAAVCMGALAWGGPVYTFEGIVDGSETSVDLDNQAFGASHLFVELNPVGTDQVVFRFTSTADPATQDVPSITGVYFDYNGELSNPELGEPMVAGVEFGEITGGSAKPPRGQNLDGPFNAAATDFAASSKGAPDGVDSESEYLDVIFDGQFDDVQQAMDDGSIRIALHVQSFPVNGDSMSFVNNGTTVIPAPGSVILAGMGTVLVGWIRKQKK